MAGSNTYAKDPKLAGLKRKLEQVVAPLNGTVGIAVMDLETHETITVNNGHHYPMQSVYKLPLAMYILDMVDKGKLALPQVEFIQNKRLDKDTWSPLADEYPKTDAYMTLANLLRYTVSKSDNNTCDILFEMAGGTQVVNNYIHKLGVNDIAITATESGMKQSWEVQYTNWCQPTAMLKLLQMVHEGTVLSKENNTFLLKLLAESENSPKRLKGQLPNGAEVAHKTGTSGRNSNGMIAGTNDVGIITLPDGRHYAIVVYVSNYMGGYDKGEQIIATISKCVWDDFIHNP